MGNCSECGKKLRFYEGYIHPLRGKKNLVCNACFNTIMKGIAFYNTCLFKGRENHREECYFWDAQTKRCRNEATFKQIRKRKTEKKKQ
jgi:hypothetical protein